jgi:hypothetical protein
MKETVASIIKWSEETFGDNITLEGQLQKFKDEIEEWFESDQKDIEELADMAIVASSVARFSVVEAIRCFSYVAESLSYSKFTVSELEEAINKKQAKNRKRKWGKGKGNYQHISEGGEE